MKKIPLSQGKFALVDDEDFPEVSKYKWCFMGGQGYGKNLGYATRTDYTNGKKNKKVIRMHRFILGLNGKTICDHINGDGLDNRRINLRICNKAQNRLNTQANRNNSSGFKGVSKCGKGWLARIGLGMTRISLGVFPTKTDAAIAYNNAARKCFGEFAKLNVV